MAIAKPEYWLQGPVANIPGLLQPVAHALLQAREEIKEAVATIDDDMIWQQPNGVASVSFHLQHIVGVLDRLFTYADEKQLNETQLSYLRGEGKQQAGISLRSLIANLDKQIDYVLQQLAIVNPETLLLKRGVGRQQIPSTKLGLLFHAAEHTMRHTGQLIVTVKFLTKIP